MGKRFVEEFQICEGFLPVNMATAANTGDRVNMKDYGRLMIILFKAVGTAGEDPTITVLQHDAVTAGTSKAVNFTKVWKKQAATNLQAVALFTEVVQAEGNTFTHADLAEQAAIIVIEINAEDLDIDNGFTFVNAAVADVGTDAQLGCLLYILGDPRYWPPPPTAIS